MTNPVQFHNRVHHHHQLLNCKHLSRAIVLAWLVQNNLMLCIPLRIRAMKVDVFMTSDMRHCGTNIISCKIHIHIKWEIEILPPCSRGREKLCKHRYLYCSPPNMNPSFGSPFIVTSIMLQINRLLSSGMQITKR